MAKRPPKQEPPYRISVRPADISPEEAEVRLQGAFDIVFDEVFRLREDGRKRRRSKSAG